MSDLRHFNNIMVHQLQGDLKYLCCISCQSSIVGYQVISKPDQIYVSCERVKLENVPEGMQEMEEEDEEQYVQAADGQQEEY